MSGARAALIAVGTELVSLGRHDTNGHFLAESLGAAGVQIAARMLVPDDVDEIAAALRAFERYPLVIVTGGLGPTMDDVTREAVSRAFQIPLKENRDVREELRRRYPGRERDVSRWSERQAQVPRGAVILPNAEGTAPGLMLDRPDGCRLFLLPGVPHEMRRMMREEVLSRLEGRAGDVMTDRGFKVTGLVEVEVQARLSDLFEGKGGANDPVLTLLAAPAEISVIVRGRERVRVEAVTAQARSRFGRNVFTEDLTEGLEASVGRVLSARGLTMASAESCTGGLFAEIITRVPGSSSWFLGGWVVYSNRAKIGSLGVGARTIAKHGAVSAEVAQEMAREARERSGASMGASITGIAGPDGGSVEKPVGTVFIGLSTETGTHGWRHQFRGNRESIRTFAARTALDRIRLRVLEERP